MNYNQIRIRDNATIREIKIEPEKLDWMKEHLKKYPGSEQKKITINKIFGSSCCVCRDFPSVEVIYQLENATRLERYCDKCITKVYERERETFYTRGSG